MQADSLAQTGIPGLDEILYGGLPREHVYLLEGTPGTGKTTIALQFVLEGLRSGEKVLYIALSETTRELHSIAHAHGWDISGIPLFEVVPVEGSINPADEYTIFHSDEVEMAETIKLILDRVEELQPSRVVIDSLAELRLLCRDPVRYRRQTLALKQHFTRKQITVLLLDDRTSQHHDHQMHSLVHGVITLERLPRDYGRNRRRLEIVKLRGAAYSDGFHDYAIQKGGVLLFPRLVSSEIHKPFTVEMVSSGMQGLDDLLGGGLDRGSATLVMGPSGCGKTTLTLKYAVAAIARGELVAFYSFDEGLNTMLSRGDSLGMNLSEHLKRDRISIEQVNPAELSPGEFAYRVRRSVLEDGAQMVVIDSLNGYLTAMPQEEFLSLQMHELLNFLNQHGVVTILILAQQGILGSMPTNIDVSYLADNIVLLRFFEAVGRVRRAISVVKKRSSRHEQTIREFSVGAPEGVQIGKPLEEFQGVLSGLPSFTRRPPGAFKEERMSGSAVDLQADPRVIIWMPVGRDAWLAKSVLSQVSIYADCSENLTTVCEALSSEQAGLAILAEEALTGESIEKLREVLAQQPPWSDLPLILLTGGGNSTGASLLKLSRMRVLGNLTLLERPIRSVTLVAAVQSALATRRRQLQTRDYIRELQDAQESLAQANADLKQFAFAASHDLQEPLRMVNIFTKMLIDRHVDPSNQAARQFSEYISTSVARMEMLLRDLLHYSRAIHEEQSWATTEFPLEGSIADAIKALQLEIDSTKGNIQYASMPMVNGDRLQLSLVFQNLIGNSIKYARHGVPPVIRISSRQEGSEVLISIQDNGIGFDQRYAERIFELFQRLGANDAPGTGLGLAICRRIIERHKGRIWADSKLGEGSTFTVALPLPEKLT